MAARREHGKSMVGAGERRRKLVSTLGGSKTRTQSRAAEKQHQLEE
jgi:hypothetical protein